MSENAIVVDVAKFQDYTQSFFQGLKDNGAEAVIVQITAGSKGHPYSQNPLAALQINNARAVGLNVHVYHYSYAYAHDDMLTEAQNFIETFNRLGLDKNNTVSFLDEEDSDNNPSSATDDCNTWLNAVKDAGIKKVGTYSMASWFTSGRIDKDRLISPLLWVANYGGSEPGVDNVKLWQFTDNWNGVDASYDFDNIIAGNKQSDQPVVALQPDNVQPTPEWKPVTYTIQDGDNLTIISQKTGDSIATIVANNPDVFNGDLNATIYPGQELAVNDRGMTFNQLDEKTYTVQDGDNLYAISQKIGDRTDTVVANNPDVFNGNLNATIYPGQAILYYR
ncbi:GH25 family lysozyme [Fructilactobacillus vespulae]|uniref:GH25 family lysozyme n=1 Tax=Fructilactobacillus vespulae TaxID=1249630 RepID=UPI0039B3F6AB